VPEQHLRVTAQRVGVPADVTAEQDPEHPLVVRGQPPSVTQDHEDQVDEFGVGQRRRGHGAGQQIPALGARPGPCFGGQAQHLSR
jgi:hypothetical protein